MIGISFAVDLNCMIYKLRGPFPAIFIDIFP